VVRARRNDIAPHAQESHADEQSSSDGSAHAGHTGQARAFDERSEERTIEDQGGSAAASMQQSASDASEVLLLDFVPMQFDDTVICVGASDAVWPSDVELLATLLVKPDQARRAAARSRRRKVAGVVLCCVAACAAVALGSLLMTTRDSHVERVPDVNDVARQVNDAFAAQHLTELHAQAAGPNVRVTGMVATPADDTAARKLLQRIASGIGLPQYDVAETVARNIEESLATSGVQVTYAGQGVFDVTASVADPHTLEGAIARVRRDLDGNVKALRTHITEASRKAPSFSEMIASNGVQYAQTPDGTKHIYVGTHGSAASPLSALAISHEASAPDSSAAHEKAVDEPVLRVQMANVEPGGDPK
jgi:type III secretion protein D